MILFWRIRYLDRTDLQFKNRDLFVDTEMLSSIERAAVEIAVITHKNGRQRDFLKYKPLFHEDNSPQATERWLSNANEMKSFCLNDYFEDDAGNEISHQHIGRILTGNPNAVSVPSGAEQHDIDLMLAESKELPIVSVKLLEKDLQLLGYFVRDFYELSNSSFMKDGPGTITGRGGLTTPISDAVLETAANDEEIRSFVTLFRRLYMASEPANVHKAIAVFADAIGDHPFGKWVKAAGQAYESKLEDLPETRPFIPLGTCKFTRKRLIDVFIYTQYAHQPSAQRQRQFVECLNDLNGKKGLLTWLFLTELWTCTLQIGNAGRVITNWFERYCEHHQVKPDILVSIAHDIPGIGCKEKKAAEEVRLFREKSEQIAFEIWKENGCPSSGPSQFLEEAAVQLRKLLESGPR